jgi:hypothetical protein
MGQRQDFGTKANLKDGPRSMEHSGAGGGTRQDFGVKAPLASSPSSNKFSAGGGTRQDFGTKASLDSTPTKGFQGVPMSKRAIKQSQ